MTNYEKEVLKKFDKALQSGLTNKEIALNFLAGTILSVCQEPHLSILTIPMVLNLLYSERKFDLLKGDFI